MNAIEILAAEKLYLMEETVGAETQHEADAYMALIASLDYAMSVIKDNILKPSGDIFTALRIDGRVI